jgi:hypothetical protein
MWRQKSRTNWLKHGDQNTKYFHRKASWRAKKDKIKRLKNDEGAFVEEDEDLEKLANDYFKHITPKMIWSSLNSFRN